MKKAESGENKVLKKTTGGTMISKFKKEWHIKNLMPKSPAPEQRINWHTEHQKHCVCRGIPQKLLEVMKTKKVVWGVLNYMIEFLISMRKAKCRNLQI